MAEQKVGSGIAWTNRTWNPIRGCRRVNKDCINCYAEAVAARFSDKGQPYEGLAVQTAQGPRWTGEIRVIEEHLRDPLRWKRPRLVFVNSMSDLFFEDLPFDEIDRIVAVMAAATQHTFQVLTKRPARMREYLSTPTRAGRVWDAVGELPMPKGYRPPQVAWPLQNVWWGASMGHQAVVDAFLPELIGIRRQAAVTWISAEPLTEPITLHPERWYLGPLDGEVVGHNPIDWLVIGGESGTHARLFELGWAEALMAECRRADIRIFMKQVGRHPMLDGEMYALDSDQTHGAEPLEWPASLRVRDFPKQWLGV